MTFLDIFRKKRPVPPAETTVAPIATEPERPRDKARTVEEMRADPELVEVYDEYGRERFIERRLWREEILPGMLRSQWNDAEALSGTILAALEEKLFDELISASAHLQEIDADCTRAASIRGAVLLASGRPEEAGRVLERHLDEHGDDAAVLTQLARTAADRGDAAEVAGLLWRALECDANGEGALAWLAATARESGGERAELEVFERAARLAGAWRPLLWIARSALRDGDPARALKLYAEALARAGDPAPADLLMQASGDLGQHGHLEELLAVVAPRFRLDAHGLQVGNNLIKANVDLGSFAAAREIVRELWTSQRPDWEETLGFWEGEIQRLELERRAPLAADELETTMLYLPGPVWMSDDGPLADVTAEKSGPRICLLGSTATIQDAPGEVVAQTSNAAGRVSRALPLFLAEYFHFTSDAETFVLVPWVGAQGGGFLLAGSAWPSDDACRYARSVATPADLVVVIHLDAAGDGWRAELRCLRTADSSLVCAFELDFSAGTPAAVVPDLLAGLRQALVTDAGAESRPAPDSYRIPADSRLDAYLLRLEQCLAVRCATLVPDNPGFLTNPGEIVDGMIRLNLEYPTSPSCRALLAYTLLRLKEVQPELVKSFRDKIEKLHEGEPLPGTAHSALSRAFRDALRSQPRGA